MMLITVLIVLKQWVFFKVVLLEHFNKQTKTPNKVIFRLLGIHAKVTEPEMTYYYEEV